MVNRSEWFFFLYIRSYSFQFKRVWAFHSSITYFNNHNNKKVNGNLYTIYRWQREREKMTPSQKSNTEPAFSQYLYFPCLQQANKVKSKTQTTFGHICHLSLAHRSHRNMRLNDDVDNERAASSYQRQRNRVGWGLMEPGARLFYTGSPDHEWSGAVTDARAQFTTWTAAEWKSELNGVRGKHGDWKRSRENWASSSSFETRSSRSVRLGPVSWLVRKLAS